MWISIVSRRDLNKNPHTKNCFYSNCYWWRSSNQVKYWLKWQKKPSRFFLYFRHQFMGIQHFNICWKHIKPIPLNKEMSPWHPYIWLAILPHPHWHFCQWGIPPVSCLCPSCCCWCLYWGSLQKDSFDNAVNISRVSFRLDQELHKRD